MGLDYKSTIKIARAELAALEVERESIERRRQEIEQRVKALTQTINALAPLVGEEPIPTIWSVLLQAGAETLKDMGITQSIRLILQSSEDALGATDIRDRMQEQGWNMTPGVTYSNPLAAIHNVLKRFPANEVSELQFPDGKRYKWVGPRPSSGLPPMPPTKLSKLSKSNARPVSVAYAKNKREPSESE